METFSLLDGIISCKDSKMQPQKQSGSYSY